jgi:hypothetical protein
MSVRLLLITGLVVTGTTGVLFSDLSLHVRTAGQQKARKLSLKTWANEPIKVVAVKGKDGRAISMDSEQLAEDDWLRDLTISIKNMSNKNVLFVELELHFTRPLGSSDEAIAVFPVIFGTPPMLAKEGSPILPSQENWQATLSSQQYAALAELLVTTGYPTSVKNLEIITREVVFADKTKWIAGRMRDSTTGLSKKVSLPAIVSQKKKPASFQRDYFQPVNLKEVLPFTRPVKVNPISQESRAMWIFPTRRTPRLLSC